MKSKSASSFHFGFYAPLLAMRICPYFLILTFTVLTMLMPSPKIKRRIDGLLLEGVWWMP